MAQSLESVDLIRIKGLLKRLFRPERSFIRVVLIYGLAISLMTLAVPVAVQTLINTVANIASPTAIVSLSVLLFVTLMLSGLLSALRTYVMEQYERRLYARMNAEVSARILFAKQEFFEGKRNIHMTQRYFDIMTLQKNVPKLLVDGFALVLQMIVGFILVSSYHETFLIFNLTLLFTIYLIWLFWGRNAMRSAVMLSHAKYQSAQWLTDIAMAHDFFKSSHHIDFAQERTDQLTQAYIDNHKLHFRYTFSQVVSFLVLYAISSAALLGIGGMLVLKHQLSIGQLVAAELVLSAIFFGLSKFTNYLKLYYQLVGAADELGLILEIPQEMALEQSRVPESAELHVHQVKVFQAGSAREINLQLAAGEKVKVFTQTPWVQKQFMRLLKSHQSPSTGYIRLGNADLSDYDVQELRQDISIIDRSLIVECKVDEFLRLSAPEASVAEMHDALAAVGLATRIDQLKDGVHTTLSAQGSPLLPNEFLLLKVAAAILAQPKVLILTQHIDAMPLNDIQTLLQALTLHPFTLLYFTNHPDQVPLSKCVMLDELSAEQE